MSCAGPRPWSSTTSRRRRRRCGVDQPGFAALVRLLKSGRAYVKVSAAYRISARPPDYPDVVPLAQALIAANPERILWGSDWPHPDAARRPGRSPTDLRPPLPVDDGRVLNQLAVWAPDPAIRRYDPGRESCAALRILIPTRHIARHSTMPGVWHRCPQSWATSR